MPPEIWVEPPSGKSVGELADWAELTMLVNEEARLSGQQLARLIGDEPEQQAAEGSDLNAGELRQVAGDPRVQSLLLEVDRRRELAPTVYPYYTDEQVLVRDSDTPGTAVYDVLLWLSHPSAPFRRGAGKTPIPPEAEFAFDELARQALSRRWPSPTRSVLFARRYARDPGDADTRPTAFPEAIRWLRALLTTDGVEDPAAGVEGDEEAEFVPARTYSDGGVDVVAWKPFPDDGPGFTVLLAQCTLERYWRRKTRDVSLTLWRAWVNFPGQVEKALAIPFAVDSDRWWWRDRNRLAGMILDRMRLCSLLGQYADAELRALVSAETAQWIDGQRAAFVPA